MLEAGRINLVPPQELGLSGCDMCGAMYQVGPEFVGFDNRSAESSDVAPGSIHTTDDGASAVALSDPQSLRLRDSDDHSS